MLSAEIWKSLSISNGQIHRVYASYKLKPVTLERRNHLNRYLMHRAIDLNPLNSSRTVQDRNRVILGKDIQKGTTSQMAANLQFAPNDWPFCHTSWIVRGHVVNPYHVDTPAVVVHLRQNTGWETEVTKGTNHSENVYDHRSTVDTDSTNSIGSTHPAQNSALWL